MCFQNIHCETLKTQRTSTYLVKRNLSILRPTNIMTGPTSRSPYHRSSSRSRRSSTGTSAPRSNGNPNSNNANSSLLSSLPGIDTTSVLNLPPGASSTTSRGSLDFNFDLGIHSNLHGSTTRVPPFHNHFDMDHSRLSFGSTATNQQTGGISSHFLTLNGSSSSSFDLSSPPAVSGNNAGVSGRMSRRNRSSLGSTFGANGGNKRVSTRSTRSATGIDGGVLANAIPNANVSMKHDLDVNRNKSIDQKIDRKDSMDNYHPQNDSMDDGVHNLPSSSSLSSGENKRLRAMIQSTMYSPTQTINPSTAAFYASILYTKTSLPSDAFLYAQALCANNEKRRAVTILDRAGLLSFETLTLEEKIISFPKRHESFDQVQDELYDREYQHEATMYDEKKYLSCILESMLLACDCYGSFGEWEEVMNILDDACHYETMTISDHNDDDQDDIDNHELPGWQITTEEERKLLELARYLNGTEIQSSVNPVARLAFMRGKACDEAANPIRASCFLKLSLFIDVRCVDAWLYLCQRRLMTSEEELEMVTCLKFNDPEMEWLKDIFYARLSLSEHFTEEEKKSVFMGAGAGAGLFRESIGSPISSSILPNFESTPQINIDTSAIHFQTTPGSPFTFFGNKQAKGLSTQPKGISRSSGKIIEIKEQVEQSFQNLYQKHDLSQSPDILALAATRAFNSYNLALALHYCQLLYEKDPLCTSAACIQIATLTALGHKRPLFRLAHALVDADSKSGIAWYAVGCYYYACGKFDLSQQYFWRATRLDPRNAECWIAFGCAFAACDENDQANACFRSAQRLHSGSHYPMLYIGMEHLRTNNIPLAGHFLKSAISMESSDPLCANELGVWAYRKKDWNEAIKWFTLALRLYVEADIAEKDSLTWHEDDSSAQQTSDTKKHIPRFEFGNRSSKDMVRSLTDRDCVEFCQEAFWESTVFNLGQSYRKNHQFDDAIHCFEKCISLCPENCMPFAALGFTRHLIGELDGAIEAYHQALSRKSDDPFSQEMLDKALEESISMGGPFHEEDDEVHASFMKTLHSPLVPSKDSFVRRNMSTIDDAEESNISFGDSTSDIDMSMT